MRDHLSREEKEACEKVSRSGPPIWNHLLRDIRVDPGSIVEMESRIRRLESVIAASGLAGQMSTESHSESDDPPPPDTTILTDRLSTLLIDDEGSSSFLGKSDYHCLSLIGGSSHINNARFLIRLLYLLTSRITVDFREDGEHGTTKVY